MRSLLMTLLIAASPAFAEGDVAKGEKDFGKCRACHTIASADEVIVKGAKTGPNLYGVIGRPVGSAEDFRYGPGMEEAHEQGLVWDEAMLAEYLLDPTAWLRKVTGDASARSKMTFKLKDGADVAAYLATFSAASTN